MPLPRRPLNQPAPEPPAPVVPDPVVPMPRDQVAQDIADALAAGPRTVWPEQVTEDWDPDVTRVLILPGGQRIRLGEPLPPPEIDLTPPGRPGVPVNGPDRSPYNPHVDTRDYVGGYPPVSRWRVRALASERLDQMGGDRLVPTREAARLLGVKETTVRSWHRRWPGDLARQGLGPGEPAFWWLSDLLFCQGLRIATGKATRPPHTP